MNIISKATHTGQTTAFAYEIEDHGETYFVMKEALTNDVILPELLRSGWKLRSLPLGLQKDGMALDDLPETPRTFSDEELMDMQSIEGNPISDTALRTQYLDRSDAEVLPQKPGDYTITTREEFLAYLSSEDRTDVRPLNYFVSPAARFTLEEYMDLENREWIKRTEQRRRLTIDEFWELRDWMLSKGLDPAYSFQDFLDFYFSWGICGLTLSFTMQNRIRHYYQTINKNAMEIYHRAYGLIDADGNLYKEPGAERHEVLNPRYCESSRRACVGDEVKAIQLYASIPDASSQWECMELSQPVEFDSRILRVGELEMNSIRVMYKEWSLSSDLLSANKKDALYDDMYLRALAEDFLEKRRVYANVSSYKALTESGCSPLSALMKLADAYNKGLEGKATALDTGEDKEANQRVEIHHIDAYLQRDVDTIPSEVLTFLEDATAGSFNIDGVKNGIMQDASQTAENIYIDFYCAHHILGVDLDTIYQSVSAFTGEHPLVLRNDGKSININSEPIDYALKGYEDDLDLYREEQARQSADLLWVDLVTREPSVQESTRHVGVRFYVLHQEMLRAQEALKMLREEYTQTVQSSMFDEDERKRLLNIKYATAASMLMSCMVRGYWKYPDALGGKVYKPDPETMEKWNAGRGLWFVGPLYEDTVTLSDNAIMITDYLSNVQWSFHVVNAIITPYRVKPRPGMNIRETSLNAVWRDMSMNPNFMAFKKNNAIRPTDGIWSIEARKNRWFRDHREYTVSLVDYWGRLEAILDEHPERRIVQPPHPLGIGYARFSEDMVLAPAEPGKPRGFSCGCGHMLSFEKEELELVRVKRSVYPFLGINSEDFFYTKGSYTLPTTEGKVPMFAIDEHIFLNDKEIRPADIENLDPARYPVVHLCGRRYLVRDARGPVWVVEV